jgi:hypothetical protein
MRKIEGSVNVNAKPKTETDREIEAFLEELWAQPDYPTPKPKPPKPKEAEIVPWPKPLSEMELARRQRIIDACWERTLAERAELEAEAAQTCHRGPGDPDYWR